MSLSIFQTSLCKSRFVLKIDVVPLHTAAAFRTHRAEIGIADVANDRCEQTTVIFQLGSEDIRLLSRHSLCTAPAETQQERRYGKLCHQLFKKLTNGHIGIEKLIFSAYYLDIHIAYSHEVLDLTVLCRVHAVSPFSCYLLSPFTGIDHISRVACRLVGHSVSYIACTVKVLTDTFVYSEENAAECRKSTEN